MARYLYRDSGTLLAELLEAGDCFDGGINVKELAWEGWKQPQQLEAVAYYLALGGTFDLLINLDGFNDIVVAATRADGVFPAYPAQWSRIAASGVAPGALRLIGSIAQLQSLRYQAAHVAAHVPWSITINVLWFSFDRWFRSALESAMEELHGMEASDDSYGRIGPSWTEGGPLGSKEQFAADLWMRSSELLAELAEAAGAHYWHFLQPNQYVPHSKALTAEEAGMVVVKSIRLGVEKGYPLLQSRGKELSNRHVFFHDATNVFSNESETVFADGCCHFNSRGNSILAAFIAEMIINDLDQAKECPELSVPGGS